MTKSLLLIDTTIHGAAVGLAEWEGAWRVVEMAFHEEIMGSAAALCDLWSRVSRGKEIGRVLVGHGPGSFTGIKVGLAFAYGLAYGSGGGLAVEGFSALEAAASSLAAKDEELLLVLPATRTHGFAARAENGTVSSFLFEVARHDPDSRSRRILARPWSELQSRDGGFETLSPQQLIDRAFAKAVESLGPEEPKNNDGKILSRLPTPRYLRLSTAEEKLGLRSLGDDSYGSPPQA